MSQNSPRLDHGIHGITNAGQFLGREQTVVIASLDQRIALQELTRRVVGVRSRFGAKRRSRAEKMYRRKSGAVARDGGDGARISSVHLFRSLENGNGFFALETIAVAAAWAPPLAPCTFDDAREPMSADEDSGPSRIRTCNQGIMSPLLCR